MIECLRVNMALADRWHVSPRPDDSDSQSLDVYSYFRQGKAAMMVMYTWNLPFLRSRCADVDWNIVNNPTFHQRGHWASSQAILVSSDTEYPDEAWMLCKGFFGEEIQRTMGQRGLPSNLGVARELIEENRRQGGVPRNLEALLKAADSLYPTPRIANLSEIMSLYYECVGGVTVHRITPEKAMAKAEKSIRLFLRRRRRLAE